MSTYPRALLTLFLLSGILYHGVTMSCPQSQPAGLPPTLQGTFEILFSFYELFLIFITICKFSPVFYSYVTISLTSYYFSFVC